MKLNKVLFGMILSASAFSALAAEPAPVIDISQSSSGANSKSVIERLENLERQVKAKNKAQVKVQMQLDELQQEFNELRGVTELHAHKLSQVLERQRELYQELDRRVSQQAPSSPTPESTANQQPVAPESNTTVYSSDITENDAYDRAVNLVLKEKRYEEAIPEFKAFNLKFPNSAYAANSHYWLGQLLFNKNDLQAAKNEFEIVYTQFTDSPKRSDSMLKLAIVEQKLNNNAKAKSLFQELIARYPSSSAAKLAKPKLEKL
jgi:tol-pal system protein YbgF